MCFQERPRGTCGRCVVTKSVDSQFSLSEEIAERLPQPMLFQTFLQRSLAPSIVELWIWRLALIHCTTAHALSPSFNGVHSKAEKGYQSHSFHSSHACLNR